MIRELRWVAQYADGRIVREFDYDGPPELGRFRETPWWDVDLSRVISFGVEGSGLRVGFRADDGVIGVNGKGLELALEDRNGRIFPITHRWDVVYKPVQFKEAFSALSRLGVINAIESYNVGWEIQGQDDALGNWYSKLLVKIGATYGGFIDAYLWFRCENGFVGKLRYRYAGLEPYPVETVLPADITNMIAFHLGV